MEILHPLTKEPHCKLLRGPFFLKHVKSASDLVMMFLKLYCQLIMARDWPVLTHTCIVTIHVGLSIYPSQVCNSWVGTRVPPSPRLVQKQRFFHSNGKIGPRFVQTLAYLKARCTETINFQTLLSNFY